MLDEARVAVFQMFCIVCDAGKFMDLACLRSSLLLMRFCSVVQFVLTYTAVGCVWGLGGGGGLVGEVLNGCKLNLCGLFIFDSMCVLIVFIYI